LIQEKNLDTLLDRLESLCVPILGHIYLTDRCQFSCPHCYRASKLIGDELTLDDWLRLLEEFKTEGCMDLTFSGGEPLLHPDWRKIIMEANKLKFSYEIMTNGFAMTEADAEFLTQNNCRELHISMHGWGETHDKFVGAAGSFTHCKLLAEYAVKLGLKTVIKMSLMHSNFHDASLLAKWSRDIGTIFGPSYYIIPRFNSNENEFLEDRLTPKEIRQCEHDYSEWTGRPSFSNCHDENGPYFCNMGWNRFAIDAHGQIYPCSQVKEPVGEVKTKSFREVWRYSERMNELRRRKNEKIDLCSNCEMEASCKFRCMGLFHLSTGKYEEPSPLHCEITAAWLGLDNF